MNAEPDNPSHESSERPRPIGRDVAFWLFVLIAFALFAPCVILPVQREHDRIRTERDQLAEQVAKLEATVTRNQQTLHAVQQDPSILEHLAERELNLPRPGEQRLAVQPQEVPLPQANHEPSPDSLKSLDRLPVLRQVPGWLGKPDWGATFCEPPTRQGLLIAAACSALLAAAIMLIGRGRRAQ
jgi:hypothetical protein